ncbi:MAG: Gfo/Idh/MocA family oxidoreductase [Propionibacteriaceae bacterium]|jgi:predicted dehydrogenase|nr:Gfo/Idh/MocA family oxidoreductase [Propionibacteriaceae bacterium]
MPDRTLRVAMNGVTGRMGRTQHLVRSVLPLRDQGGLRLDDGGRLQVEPILVGRNEAKLRELAARHDVAEWTTDLDAIIADPATDVVFDAARTGLRPATLTKAMRAGKAVYTEKPTAETVSEAIALARLQRAAGVTAGVVHDKLYLPGLVKLRRLVEEGFFGRPLSFTIDFGYWVFEGQTQPSQRPSWNYRREAGGSLVTDMYSHWNYVMEGVVGRVRDLYTQTATQLDRRWDERGQAYRATADDAAYGIFGLETPAGDRVVAQINSSWCVRVHRDDLVEFQLHGTDGSAVATLHDCVAQQRSITPRATWDPDVRNPIPFRDQWSQVPANADLDNGFKAQWAEFLADVAAGRPHRFDLLSAARGAQLADLALQSSAEGRRLDVPEIEL